jgi:hypothetical protein
MSATPLVNAESIGLLVATEASLGTQPTSGWQTLQPNAGGLDGFYLHTKTVARSPLTRQRQMEASEIVDADATPKITHDVTKDLIDAFASGLLLATPKSAGGTGVAYFLPTARTTTDYTVAAGGALQAGTLVYARGFVNTANNGLFQVGSSSGATAVKVASGTAETVSGYVATLEVAGFRGASGDIQLNGSGNLISTVADFTTMGLTVGQVIWVGGTVGSGHDFATAGYRGFAKITAIAANLVTLSRRAWTVASADTGTGKTIDLYWGRWLRTVAFGAADYTVTSYQMELTYTGLSGGTTDEYVYAAGNLIDQWTITLSQAAIVTAEIQFLGTTITDPSTSRATGASTAGAPLAIEAINSVTKLLYERIVVQATEALVSDDIDTSKLTVMNHVTPQKQHGTLGTKRDVVGKNEVSLDANVFLVSDDALKACRANTTLAYGVGLRNGDFGMFFDVPSLKCIESPPSFPANGPVTLALKLAAFRDAVGNYTMGVSLFPFLPVG